MAILTIIEAALGKLIGDEIRAWLSQAGPRLLQYSVSRLPANERERYSEEWATDLEAIPGDISRLVYGLGLVRAAGRICASIKSPQQSAMVTEVVIVESVISQPPSARVAVKAVESQGRDQNKNVLFSVRTRAAMQHEIRIRVRLGRF